MLHFLRHIIQLFISPVKGWEDVSAAGIAPSELTRRGLYPLLGILALTSIIRLLYHQYDYTLVEALQNAIINFTVYFVTPFIAGAAFSSFMPRFSGVANTEFKNQSFIIFSVALLTIINIASNLLPVDHVITMILPLYVIFVMFRGIRYLDVEQNKAGYFMFLAVATIMAPPFVLSFLFKIIMP